MSLAMAKDVRSVASESARLFNGRKVDSLSELLNTDKWCVLLPDPNVGQRLIYAFSKEWDALQFTAELLHDLGETHIHPIGFPVSCASEFFEEVATTTPDNNPLNGDLRPC